MVLLGPSNPQPEVAVPGGKPKTNFITSPTAVVAQQIPQVAPLTCIAPMFHFIVASGSPGACPGWPKGALRPWSGHQPGSGVEAEGGGEGAEVPLPGPGELRTM